MPYLEVQGADLYYEAVGKGPMLLCISGANGNADPWKEVAEQLKDHFTVVMYDRRGFSHSYLSGAQDYQHRIETDADDAAALIKFISPNEPAFVIGNSSGAVVSLVLFTRHPDVLTTLMPHEPPAHTLLADCVDRRKDQEDMYATYRAAGMQPALEKFGINNLISPSEASGLMAAFNPRTGPHVFANCMYWFEREVLDYPYREFDIEELRKLKDKLLLLNGEESIREAPHYRPNVVLHEKTGARLEFMPGAHFGFVSHPQQFAQKLIEVLKV